jgi:hypothetical protein
VDPLGLIGIAFLVLTIAVPTLMMILMFYHGEKSRREELRANKFYRRGFEVKLTTAEPPVPQEERKNDHG